MFSFKSANALHVLATRAPAGSVEQAELLKAETMTRTLAGYDAATDTRGLTLEERDKYMAETKEYMLRGFNLNKTGTHHNEFSRATTESFVITTESWATMRRIMDAHLPPEAAGNLNVRSALSDDDMERLFSCAKGVPTANGMLSQMNSYSRELRKKLDPDLKWGYVYGGSKIFRNHPHSNLRFNAKPGGGGLDAHQLMARKVRKNPTGSAARGDLPPRGGGLIRTRTYVKVDESKLAPDVS